MIDRKAAFSRQNLARRLDQGDDERKRLHTNRRLESASIGAGGLRVLNGFIVILDEQGNEQMRLSTEGLTMEGLLSVIGAILVTGGGDVTIGDGGGFVITGGGSAEISDGGALIVRHPNGEVGAVYGDFSAIGTGGTEDGVGLLIQDDTGADILRAMEDDAGVTLINVGAGTAAIDELITISDVLSISARNGGSAVFGTLGGGNTVLNSSGHVSLEPDPASSLFARIPDTTGSSANLVRDGSGLGIIARSTSAARHKVDIADLTVDPQSVPRLRPRTWRDKSDVSRDPDSDRWNVGLVAEEVIEAGLTAFVDHDSEGNPDRVAYDRLSIALLALCQQQERRLGELEKRVNALDGQESKLDPVEPTVLPVRRETKPRGRNADSKSLGIVSDPRGKAP